MNDQNPLGSQASLPSVDGQQAHSGAAPAGQSQPPVAPAVGAESNDPKLLLAQFSAAAEVIILRTQSSPRARAEQLALLKQQYIKTRFGMTIQAPSE